MCFISIKVLTHSHKVKVLVEDDQKSRSLSRRTKFSWKRVSVAGGKQEVSAAAASGDRK